MNKRLGEAVDQLKHYKTNFYNSNTKNQIYRLGYSGSDRPLMLAVSEIVGKNVPPKTMIYFSEALRAFTMGQGQRSGPICLNNRKAKHEKM